MDVPDQRRHVQDGEYTAGHGGQGQDRQLQQQEAWGGLKGPEECGVEVPTDGNGRRLLFGLMGGILHIFTYHHGVRISGGCKAHN